MKAVVAYFAIQVVLLIFLGFDNPLALLAIPVGLAAQYGLLALIAGIINGRKSEPGPM